MQEFKGKKYRLKEEVFNTCVGCEFQILDQTSRLIRCIVPFMCRAESNQIYEEVKPFKTKMEEFKRGRENGRKNL